MTSHHDFDSVADKYIRNVMYAHLLGNPSSNIHLELEGTIQRYVIAYFHHQNQWVYTTQKNIQNRTK